MPKVGLGARSGSKERLSLRDSIARASGFFEPRAQWNCVRGSRRSEPFFWVWPPGPGRAMRSAEVCAAPKPWGSHTRASSSPQSGARAALALEPLATFRAVHGLAAARLADPRIARNGPEALRPGLLGARPGPEKTTSDTHNGSDRRVYFVLALVGPPTPPGPAQGAVRSARGSASRGRTRCGTRNRISASAERECGASEAPRARRHASVKRPASRDPQARRIEPIADSERGPARKWF